ncbi:hypothetical protein [Actinopolymorpha rutila]|uniref:Zinc-ribbon domain-containing protein n=1 Tax=Actinopolymorpha rutila TaxID=446787 RepID=A0A852Z3J9_9ACTN|nr:hypothetical protein [Actinopolymorpha rutila]NYH87381.1 hypothetical protein [Actinopolymorpha rutila]
MRCARCGYDNPDNPRTCARCGLALADSSDPVGNPVGDPAGDPGAREVSDPAEEARPSHIQPSWRRPAEAPAESPPWSGSVDAAPWQTPPRRGTPPNRPATDTPAATSATTGGPPFAAEPPRAVSGRPDTLGRVLVVLLAVEIVLAVVYAVFSLGPRRGVFAALAADPAGVDRAEAVASDGANLVLFTALGFCTLAAAVLGGWWASRAGRASRSRPVRWGPAWWIVTVAAAVVIAAALVLHAGQDTGRIATGYVLLGLGCVLLAGSAAWALVVVRRHGRRTAAGGDATGSDVTGATSATGRAGSGAERSQAGPDSEGPGHLVR